MQENNAHSEDDTPEQISSRKLAEQLTQKLSEQHELFHDTQKQPYIAINHSGTKVLSLNGNDFKYWLLAKKMDAGEYISTHTIDEIVRRLQAIAVCKTGNPKPLTVRIHRIDGREGFPEELWYDLGREDGLAVHITKSGYAIEEPPIIFRKYDHQHEQVKPSAKDGGKLDDLFELVNLTERADKVAFTVFLVSCFLDKFPKPVLLIRGTNGSGKSTPMRILHNLIDPSELEAGTPLVRDNGELARIANKCAILHFDNVDGREITPEVSNAICRITSGQAFARRALYTNDDDVIFKGQRPVMLNGIGKLVEREDLLDRCLIFNTKRISEDKRKTEAEIFARLKEMKPYLLHEIFTILSKVLLIYPTVELADSHCLADFDKLGFAICEAIDGYSGEEWLKISDKVFKRQVESAFEASAVAQIAKFLVDRSKFHIWEGTATDMLGFRINEDDNYLETPEDKNLKQSIRDNPTFPKNASSLGIQLNRAESTLRSLGIIIEHSRNGKDVYKDGARWITLKDHGWIKFKEKQQDNAIVCPF